MARARKTLEERFWSHVVVKGPDECWPWDGRTDGGYGRIRLADGSSTGAHRVAYEIQVGPIPEGLDILHNCPGGDLPACCNGKHLRPGTHTENMQDMVAKGRNRFGDQRGEKGSKAKLTDDQVRDIRRRVAAGEAQRAIARELGLSSTAISYIARRVNWRHIA